MADRPRDLIWDALEEHFGPVRTPSERSKRNRAVKELRIAEATPEEVRRAIDYCERTYSTYSEMAVCTNFSRAQQEVRSPAQRAYDIAYDVLRGIEGGKQ